MLNVPVERVLLQISDQMTKNHRSPTYLYLILESSLSTYLVIVPEIWVFRHQQFQKTCQVL